MGGDPSILQLLALPCWVRPAAEKQSSMLSREEDALRKMPLPDESASATSHQKQKINPRLSPPEAGNATLSEVHIESSPQNTAGRVIFESWFWRFEAPEPVNPPKIQKQPTLSRREPPKSALRSIGLR
jgi:hypothetical protein